MAEQQLEQVVLDAGEGEDPLPALGLAGDRIELEVAEAEDLVRIRRPAPEQGPKAGQQLGQGEGLDQVVVGPDVETLDPVADGVAGGEHEHRRVVVRRPQPAAHLETVDPGEPDVEHQGLRRPDGDLLEGRGAIRGQGDLVALEPQCPVERAAHGRIVVDDEYPHDLEAYRRPIPLPWLRAHPYCFLTTPEPGIRSGCIRRPGDHAGVAWIGGN